MWAERWWTMLGMAVDGLQRRFVASMHDVGSLRTGVMAITSFAEIRITDEEPLTHRDAFVQTSWDAFTFSHDEDVEDRAADTPHQVPPGPPRNPRRNKDNGEPTHIYIRPLPGGKTRCPTSPTPTQVRGPSGRLLSGVPTPDRRRGRCGASRRRGDRRPREPVPGVIRTRWWRPGSGS